MQEVIKRIHATEGFDALWRWAKTGKGKRERYKRFRALQQWAQGNRDNSKGAEQRKWNERRKAYRSQARKVLRRIRDNPGLGDGPFGGTQSIIELVVLPVYVRHGIPTTSVKRWETYGNPGSDHWFGNLIAYAADGGIANAQWLHQEIAAKFRAMGATLTPMPSDYAMCYCVINGKRFRYQGIASTHGTGPHYHAGAKVA